MKKLFFVTYGAGHSNIVRLVYKGLCKSNKYNVEILALTTAVVVFEKDNIPYKQIKDYIEFFPYKEEAIEYGRKLLSASYSPTSGVSYEESISYLGLSFYDLYKDVGSYEKAINMYQTSGRQVFNPIATLDKIVDIEKPDLILLTCDVRMEKAAGIVGNRRNIPVLRINDLPTILPMPYEAKVCVMNQFAKEYAIKNKILEEKDIIVTGQPVIEDNCILDKVEVEMFKKKYDLNRYKHVFVFFTECGKDQRVIFEQLNLIAKKHDQDLFFIKPHPNQSELSYNFDASNCILSRDYPAKYYISACDIAITTFSTTGMEAAMLDKMLIIINIDHQAYNPDYCEYGIAEKVDKLDELEKCIYQDCLLSEDNQKRLKQARDLFQNKSDAVKNICYEIDRFFI